MTFDYPQADALAIAAAVRSGEISAKTVVETVLNRISTHDPALNSFTEVMANRAIAAAVDIDHKLAVGIDPGVLTGVPFAVKNLFDVAGITTLAGSKINRDRPPARHDATAIAALKHAGAILVGTLNMDEYAYGFVTENTHYGPTRNPHDLTRIAGGSSGGSAAAVAAGLIPLSLGSDTNGSIRVPAALCGVYGLKPTYGRLSRAGVALFSSSFDHIGPLARSVRDITTVYDILQGADPADPVSSNVPPEPCLPQLAMGLDSIRLAVAEGYFATADPEVLAAVDKVAQALQVNLKVSLPEPQRARAAAYIITASEGANLHLEDLRRRPQDFDPETRDRFLAGALIPANWYLQAQRFRSWYRNQVHELFHNVDVIIAPTTPCVATPLGQKTLMIKGQEVPLRPTLGLYTQPLSFIGLPVLSIPIQRENGLPIGVQLIAAPYQEALILRVAALLESLGVTSAPVANLAELERIATVPTFLQGGEG